MQRLFFLCLLFVAIPRILYAQKLDTLRVDPVELIKGTEVAGKAQLASAHGNYLYFFANAENKARFDRNPAQYEIQMGGGCGRMGSLSGVGKTSLFTVYQDKIYIFASEACRTTFLNNTEKLLEVDDPMPATTVESQQMGQSLLARVLDGVGGADKVDGLTSYQEHLIEETVYQGENVETSQTATSLASGYFRTDQTWADKRWSAISTPNDGFFVEPNGIRAMVAPQRKALENEFAHHVLYILRKRHQPGFVAVAAGSGLAGQKPVDYLTVHYDGTTTTLGVDAKTGRVLSVSYRGRGPNLFFGKVEKFFSQFRNVEGLILPVTVSGKFDGEIVPEWSKTLTAIAVNKDFGGDYFRRKLE